MTYQSPNPVEAPGHVLSLFDRLHSESENQEAAFDIYKHSGDGLQDSTRDKFIALDRDKCHYMYQLCRAINAKNIVEAGTSFGVSTMYLGLAVTRNIENTGGTGTVIGTEHEPSKADKARAYWAEAGGEVSRRIDLRVGDLRETLKENLPQIDLLLLDSRRPPQSALTLFTHLVLMLTLTGQVWAPMTLPALKLVQPKLRHGAVVLVDNSIASAERYKDLLTHLRAPGSGFINMTLPFNKGLEMSVYLPSQN